MSDMALDYKIHRVTVDEFFQMGEAGIFEDRHVELLDGALVDLSPIGWSHAVIASHLEQYLATELGDSAVVVHHVTLPLGAYNAPEPDVAVFSASALEDMPRRARLEDAQAIVEVAETSLRKDLGVKLRLYAASGIAEYVVVDVGRAELRRFTNPSGDSYKTEQRLTHGDRFNLEAHSGITLDVDRFLPPISRS
jgi:Uma2 family endonuclease